MTSFTLIATCKALSPNRVTTWSTSTGGLRLQHINFEGHNSADNSQDYEGKR